ncbi:MAG: exodeoxyribonuclease VII small subunit [Planctomycetes bacterium SCN 63-9]|nr:MAG: exodeoxyribonuclease VII small subunit [Planctomycetes bacterium SCN 63-9]
MNSESNRDQAEKENELDLAFETALDQLEGIVAGLERGQPELATALANYERGLHLLNHCHSILDRAERSVSLLTGVADDGTPLSNPFDATATAQRKNG